METKPTPSDQFARDAIRDDIGLSMVVEAGAGTGKTTSLVARLVNLLTHEDLCLRVRIDQVVAITFTRKAAAELKDRLRRRLEQKAVEDPVARPWCEAALAGLDGAAIQTIDAFCQRVLTRFATKADLPLRFDILDDFRSRQEFDAWWEGWLDSSLAEFPDEWSRALAAGVDVKQLRKVASAFERMWDRLDRSFESETPDRDELVRQWRALASIDTGQKPGGDTMVKKLLGLRQALERYEAAASPYERIALLLAIPLGRRGNAGSQKVWGPDLPSIRTQIEDFRGTVDAVGHACRWALAAPLLEKLRVGVLNHAQERTKQGRLGFHDQLVLTQRLLKDPEVRVALHREYPRILVDESQDTDPRQMEIVQAIAGEGPDKNGRLFFVGDPKQSIYRFRGADVEQYDRAKEMVGGQVVHLDNNFRSTPALIAGANAIFEKLMPQGYFALRTPQSEAAEPGSGIRTLDPSFLEMTSKPAMWQAEAEAIARAIRAAKSGPWLKADGSAVRYEDVAILFPARTVLPYLERALENAGIPYRIESQALVFATQEARDLGALLRAIDDPTDEVAVVATLKSEAGGCSDQDLYDHRAAGGRWNPLAAIPEDSPEAVRTVLNHLRQLHAARLRRPVGETVERIVREFGLLELATIRTRPRDRWQRYSLLGDLARQFDADSGGTLREFIQWWEAQMEGGAGLNERHAPEADDDAVRLMTLHAAKGLEFPVTVLAGLGGKPYVLKRPFVLQTGDGAVEVGLGSKDNPFGTAGVERAAEVEQTAAEAERLRLLYVGVTRAMDHLVVSLYREKPDGTTLADQLASALPPEHQHWDPPAIDPRPAPTAKEPNWVDDPDEWEAQRRAVLAHDPVLVTRAATTIATEILDLEAGLDDDALDQALADQEPDSGRRPGKGSSLGRAVHAVLQSVDLRDPADLDQIATAQADAEGIPDMVVDVSRLARRALSSRPVESALRGKGWKEAFFSARIEGILVEGFIDLLVQHPDGTYEVVDYKTDSVRSQADIDEAMRRYRLQGATYSLLVEAALGIKPAQCTFLFLQANAGERSVDDLDDAEAAVRTFLQGLRPRINA